MTFPTISIVIPTFNSEKILPKNLNSIKAQIYPQKKIEILIIDGGSTDKTLAIARKYHCTIIPNPQTELIYAKHIGFLQAKGTHVLFLDSDEVLENNDSLKLKLSAFLQNKKVKAVMPSGYKSPLHESPINDYINEFGDPFSFFVYRESKGYQFLIPDWKKRYPIIEETENYIIFNFAENKYLPLIELWAGGCMIDVVYFRTVIPKAKKNPALIAHFFYTLFKDQQLLALTKQDNTIHYSCPSIGKYFKKLASRVRNNVFNTSMGEGGFDGREIFQPNSFRYKKYLYLPYSFSLILPVFDSIYLALTRKKIIYFLHPILCLYTSYLILYYYAVKLSGVKPIFKTYGN
jgi:glycosyltransferase involved in cell wall biosynthesis